MSILCLPRVLVVQIAAQLQRNKINANTFARPQNLNPVIERRNSPGPLHTVQLTYHEAKGNKTWTGPLKIGSKTYNVLFSTGSSNLWVTTTTDTDTDTGTSRDGCHKTTYPTWDNRLRSGKDKMRDPPKHRVELFPQYFTDGEIALTRTDIVEVGGITVKQYNFGTPDLSFATDYFRRLPFDGQVFS